MQDKPNKIVTREGQAKALATSNAIKANFKLIKDEPAFKNVVEYAKMCYNEYNDNSGNIGLPKDVRVSYLDQATAFKKLLDYIERQTS